MDKKALPAHKTGWSVGEVVGCIRQMWFLLFLGFLIGATLSWGVVSIFPADFEATADLYVGFNPDVAVYFATPDDYKNSQLRDLEAIALSDKVLYKTLEILTEKGIAEIELDDFQNMVAMRWRNTGAWRLVIQGSESQNLDQMVLTWRQVVYEEINQVLADSEAFYLLNLFYREMIRSEIAARNQQGKLETVRKQVLNWQVDRENDRTLGSEARKSLYLLAVQANGLEPAFKELLDNFPSSKNFTSEYKSWLEMFLTILERKIAEADQSYRTNKAYRIQNTETWREAKNAASGLTPYMMVEIQEENVDVFPLQNSGMAIIMGGLLGLLAAIGVCLVKIQGVG